MESSFSIFVSKILRGLVLKRLLLNSDNSSKNGFKKFLRALRYSDLQTSVPILFSCKSIFLSSPNWDNICQANKMTSASCSGRFDPKVSIPN